MLGFYFIFASRKVSVFSKLSIFFIRYLVVGLCTLTAIAQCPHGFETSMGRNNKLRTK